MKQGKTMNEAYSNRRFRLGVEYDTEIFDELVKLEPWQSTGNDVVTITENVRKPIEAVIAGVESSGFSAQKGRIFSFATTLQVTGAGIECVIKKERILLIGKGNLGDKEPLLEEIAKANEHEPQLTIRRKPLPPNLKQPTFLEARATATALSDGPDLRNWKPISGALALLHDREGSAHQIRFEPSSRLLGWWGKGADEAVISHLENELCSLELDAVITFFICLASAIENPELDTSLDDIIAAIGRDKDARRTSATRAEWRGKIWRWLLLFDSLLVIGARPGTWREPKSNDQKRRPMKEERLYSYDALLQIIGYRGTEQGTLDNSAVPKEVSLILGPWARGFRGNREVLSEFGTLRAIATIPRGKPSGAWAACAGLMLQQRWRENASYAKVKRSGEDNKQLTQEFRPFTRKELLLETWRSGDDLQKILDSPNPQRAKDYWSQAVRILKEHGIIGHYKEMKPLRDGYDWQDEWLKQPLDIRPAGDNRNDAVEIHASAQTAKRRGRKKKVA